MFRRMMYVAILAIVVLMLAACGANRRINSVTGEETVTQTFTPGGTPHLVVEMFNGGVDVITGSDNTVNVDVTKRGSNVDVTMTQDGDTIRVVAKRTNQSVDIGNIGASAKLRVPNGAIVDLRSSNGPITTSGRLGDVKANTSNGPITIDGGSGSINAETSNGPLDITADNAVVVGLTSNGPVNFTGSLAAGRSELTSSNGSIVVTLPAAAQFVVDAETSNATINSDFAVTSQNVSKNHLSGTVGNDPGVTLSLQTSNGPISIRKSQ